MLSLGHIFMTLLEKQKYQLQEVKLKIRANY